MNEESIYELADLFKIFSDSTRIKILTLLIKQELSVNDISSKLNISVSAISHQLNNLKSSKLVKARRKGKNIYYSLADQHVETIIKMGQEHIEEGL